ncbi:MAG: trimethylamine methyltransferase family protein [Synergistaceae bacterium]|jgi:trimethylamine--corrinoid protein Co-methyltransferase|nr:trimethylamine methyltransferase family protein [Synergistaceae bacterium]
MQRYQLLTQNEIERIHENSLRIMENVGILLMHGPARDILAKAGARVDGEMVYFPKALVEKSLKNVPPSFTFHALDPEKSVEITTETTAFVGPYGAPNVVDLDKGRRPSTLEDFINIVKICDTLNNVDIQSHISCEPNDIDVDIRHNVMVHNTLKYSDKPLMGTCYGYEYSRQSIEMAAIAFGEGMDTIKRKPVIASIPCTLTPLGYDDKMAGCIMAYAEYGQPQLVNSLSMAGMTTPVTLVGLVSLQNAEVLAGIVLAQCVNPGCPIVYSASGSNADMSSAMLAIGTPEDALVSLMNGQLAKYYNIPCRISGALSDSKMMDSQAAYESAITLMMAQMAGGNFILHSVGIIDTYNSVSFEKLVIDNEIIGYVKRIGRGVVVNDDTLAYDVIKEVGPQNEFLTHEHTYNHFRTEFYRPTLSNRDVFDNWRAKGSLPIEKVANAKWKSILAEFDKTVLSPETDADLKKYVEGHRLNAKG